MDYVSLLNGTGNVDSLSMTNPSTWNPTLDDVDEVARNTRSSVGQLLELSRYGAAEVRLRALEALQYLNAREVVERIRQAVSDPDELVRATSLELLGEWNDLTSIDLMIQALSDKEWLVRAEAALALAHVGAVNATLKESALHINGSIATMQLEDVTKTER